MSMLVLTSTAKKQNFKPVTIPGTQTEEGKGSPCYFACNSGQDAGNIATKILIRDMG